MNSSKIEEDSLKELFKASHKLQKCLLSFANYKPNKKGEKGKGMTATDVIDQGIKDLVDKIVRFNTLYKKQKELKSNLKRKAGSKRIAKPKAIHSPTFSQKKKPVGKKRPLRKCVKKKVAQIEPEEIDEEEEEMKIKIKNPQPEIKEENLIGEICSFFSKKNLDKSEYDFNKLKRTIQSLKENRETEMEFIDDVKFDDDENENKSQNYEFKAHSYDRLFSGFGFALPNVDLSPKAYEFNPFIMGTTKASANRMQLTSFTPRMHFTPTPNSSVPIQGLERNNAPAEMNKRMDEFVSKLKNNISANSHKIEKNFDLEMTLDSPILEYSRPKNALTISPNSTFSFHRKNNN